MSREDSWTVLTNAVTHWSIITNGETSGIWGIPQGSPMTRPLMLLTFDHMKIEINPNPSQGLIELLDSIYRHRLRSNIILGLYLEV